MSQKWLQPYFLWFFLHYLRKNFKFYASAQKLDLRKMALRENENSAKIKWIQVFYFLQLGTMQQNRYQKQAESSAS